MGKRRLSRRIGVACAMISGGVVALAPQIARSQDAPPPIAVPTDPVPQVLTPITPGASTMQKPPAPPKPAPAPAPTATSTGGGGGGGGSTPAATTTSPAPPVKYDNDGTFKIGGLQVTTAAGSSTASSATVTPVAKPVWKPSAKQPAGVVAQWPGFRMTDDGGSEVMVEFSKGLPPPTEHKAAGSVTYLFKGAHVTKYNNENPLLTKHFNTPVFSARLVPKGWDLMLVIDLRAGVDAVPVTGQRAASDNVGQQFFVRFAKGSFLPPDEDVWTKAPNAKTEEGAKGKKSTASSAKIPATTPPTTTPGGSKMGPKP